MHATPLSSQRLRAALDAAEPLLRRISDADSATPLAPGKWSPRQVIGHLIDSAGNNHQRFVRSALQDDMVFPGYAQDDWVALQRYQDDQFDLATSLNSIQDADANIDIAPYLDRLQEQLELQQALQEFAKQEVIDQVDRDEISLLLDISSVQRLAWQRYNQSALLGERDIHPTPQATQSATPSAELEE